MGMGGTNLIESQQCGLVPHPPPFHKRFCAERPLGRRMATVWLWWWFVEFVVGVGIGRCVAHLVQPQFGGFVPPPPKHKEICAEDRGAALLAEGADRLPDGLENRPAWLVPVNGVGVESRFG